MNGIIQKMSKAVFVLPLLMMGLCTVAEAQEIETHKITLGAVQSKIKVGASGDDVIEAIGSPNIVTSGDNGSETWVYDKLSVVQKSSGNVAGHARLDDTQPSATVTGQAKMEQSTTERTMMVIVKFDAGKKVSSVQYRESSY